MIVKTSTAVWMALVVSLAGLLPSTGGAGDILSRGLDPLSGNFWLVKCSSREKSSQFLCLGFVQGLREGVAFMEMTWTEVDGELRPFASVCDSRAVTLDQIRDVFVKYLVDHPESRHERASILFVVALREAFCR